LPPLLRADAVTGVILEKPLQSGEDGLLGMSFLAGFDVVFGEKELKIAVKPAR